MFQFILTILLSLQPSYYDTETWPERVARMTIIANAIDDASSKATCEESYKVEGCVKEWKAGKKNLALLLVTKGFFESTLKKNVHEGHCGPKECDSVRQGKKVIHLARTLWQIQQTGLLHKGEWRGMLGASQAATTIAANVATRYLSTGFHTCGSIRGAMAAYGGRGCNWNGIHTRYDFFQKLLPVTLEEFEARSKKQQERLEARIKVASEKTATQGSNVSNRQ